MEDLNFDSTSSGSTDSQSVNLETSSVSTEASLTPDTDHNLIYYVSKPRAMVLLISAVFFSATASLLVTGFQGLLPTLIESGVYGNLCDDDEKGCDAQRLRLNLMLTSAHFRAQAILTLVSVSALNMACFPLGLLNDRVGPKWSGLLGSFLLMLGTVLFAFSNSESFDAYIPGYCFIGLGGVSIFISVLHVANLYPKYRGIVMTLLTAAEDMSTGIFYFFQLIYRAGISLKAIFLGYIVIPIAFIAVALIQPRKPFISDDTNSSTESGSKEYYHLSSKPLREQLKSPLFWGIVAWNAISCVATYYYLSTINSQVYELFGSQEVANHASEVISFMFMTCPIFAVLISGWVLNRYGTWLTLCIIAMQYFVCGITILFASKTLMYFSFFAFVITRASFIAATAHVANVMFGNNFSTLIGIIWTTGGVATLSNQFWVYLTFSFFESNYLIPDIFMTTICVVSTLLLAYFVKSNLSTKPGELALNSVQMENM